MGDIGVPPINPTPAPNPIMQESSGVGRRCLWVVAIGMLLSSLVFYVLAGRVPAQKRLFHSLVSLITTISFLSYFAMAMGYGVSYKEYTYHKHYKHSPDIFQDVRREVYWIRYVNWMLTVPMILTCLSFLSGVNGASLLVSISASLVMFVAALSSSFMDKHYQWAWFIISCLGYLTIVYQTGYQGRKASLAKDQKVRTFYTSIAIFALGVLLVYPIIWGISNNARKMSIDAEIIVFAVLDILLQAVFGYWLIASYNTIRSISVTLDGFWANGVNGEGNIRVGENENV
ncbi:opsin 1 [Nannizzia gypsea CBS 118893]|uniref:Opsin 1 n=1 Tax=Arthroderma gypseum (strain ATCC MYA-4604 / CBS 118893) TaxID=535722 RepID=E4V3D3_ARTGP|nr:opsin 1 [Nannizzia gypsea CBS 118893]EFR04507.1 opsin 1 [Nannizzia gypsea CBS 118893]